jgi:hypothetical protein
MPCHPLDLQLLHRFSHSTKQGEESEQHQGHQDGTLPPEDIAQSGIYHEEAAISHKICQNYPIGRIEFPILRRNGQYGRCDYGRFQSG